MRSISEGSTDEIILAIGVNTHARGAPAQLPVYRVGFTLLSHPSRTRHQFSWTLNRHLNDPVRRARLIVYPSISWPRPGTCATLHTAPPRKRRRLNYHTARNPWSFQAPGRRGCERPFATTERGRNSSRRTNETGFLTRSIYRFRE